MFNTRRALSAAIVTFLVCATLGGLWLSVMWLAAQLPAASPVSLSLSARRHLADWPWVPVVAFVVAVFGGVLAGLRPESRSNDRK